MSLSCVSPIIYEENSKLTRLELAYMAKALQLWAVDRRRCRCLHQSLHPDCLLAADDC